LILKGDFARAYQLFDKDDFHKAVPFPQFAQRLAAQRDSIGSGRLLELRGNGVVGLFLGEETASAQTQFIVRYEKSLASGRMKVELRKTDGEWRILDMDLFDIFHQTKSKTQK
jgi:hypothetical protein